MRDPYEPSDLTFGPPDPVFDRENDPVDWYLFSGHPAAEEKETPTDVLVEFMNDIFKYKKKYSETLFAILLMDLQDAWKNGRIDIEGYKGNK